MTSVAIGCKNPIVFSYTDKFVTCTNWGESERASHKRVERWILNVYMYYYLLYIYSVYLFRL